MSVAAKKTSSRATSEKSVATEMTQAAFEAPQGAQLSALSDILAHATDLVGRAHVVYERGERPGSAIL